MMRQKQRTAGALLALLLLCAWANPAAAQLTIIRNFISPGNSFPAASGLGAAGAAPGNIAGGGSLEDIFNAAADVWEDAFPLGVTDNFTVTLSFGWQELTGATTGAHRLVSQGLSNGVNRETEGAIRFDNDGSTVFFADPTPTDDFEYATYTETSTDLGGGLINTERTLSGATGFAAGRTDLFSTALHEIGHSLGLSSANTSYISEAADGDVDVIAPRPCPGCTLGVGGAHTTIHTTLMFATRPAGVRRLPTAVDILANAEISDFNSVNLAPRVGALATPEPSPLLLLLCGGGLGLLCVWVRRRAAV